MKQLITAMASVVLILSLISEFIVIHKFYIDILRADYELCTFHDLVRTDGCISKQNNKDICEALSDIFDCEKSSVHVNGPEKVIKRGELMTYEVEALIESDNVGWLIGKKYEYRYKRRYSLVSLSDFKE